MIWIKGIWHEVFHGGKTYTYEIEACMLRAMLLSFKENTEKENFLSQLQCLDLV